MDGQSTQRSNNQLHRSPKESARLSHAMAESARAVEETLDYILPKPHGLHARVHEAMRYAVFAGGKRLRPFLVLNSAQLFGVNLTYALRVAAAIEALHTYSLIHDDLPCMDDDALRRGRPTTHVAFDEATAVLAGDALLTIAFEILSTPETHPLPEVRCRLIRDLAIAAGSNGMVGGQMIDMEAEEKEFSVDTIISLQSLKTGALFEFSCVSGPILAEESPTRENILRNYAQDLGLAFQIVDDLLDAFGSEKDMGKAVGKDKDRGKATLVTALGVDGARAKAEKLARRASERLNDFGPVATNLRALPWFLLGRQS